MQKNVDILNSLRVYEANNKLPKKGNDMSISPDYTPFLGYLYTKLLEFTERMVKQLKNTKAYHENQDVLNEIDLLPIAYLYYRFPFFEYLQRFYIPFPSYQDYSGDNESFTEDMEASEAKEGQLYNDYPDGLASASAFFSNLEKVTLEDMEDYVNSYATFKKFDLDIIEEIISNWNDDSKDINWLVKVKENCLKVVSLSDFHSPFTIPSYLRYRQAWVFDMTKAYYITNRESYLIDLKEVIVKQELKLSKLENQVAGGNERVLINSINGLKLTIDIDNPKLPIFIFSHNGKSLKTYKTEKKTGKKPNPILTQEQFNVLWEILGHIRKKDHTQEEIEKLVSPEGSGLYGKPKESVRIADIIKIKKDNIKPIDLVATNWVSIFNNRIRRYIDFEPEKHDKLQLLSKKNDVIILNCSISVQRGYKNKKA